MTSGWKYVIRQIGLVLLVALLACLFLAVGLMIGYAVIGDGKIHSQFYRLINGKQLLANLQANKLFVF